MKRSVCTKCGQPVTYVVMGSRGALWVHDAKNDETKGHDANTYVDRDQIKEV